MSFPIEELEKRISEMLTNKRYISKEMGAGDKLYLKKVYGSPTNLLAVVAEVDSKFSLNNQGEIDLKRDEAMVMINVMDVESIEVSEGKIKLFTTTVPKWMPALFWTRSVTVLGVADAVRNALSDYGAAKDSTLTSVLPRYLTDQSGNDLSDYIIKIVSVLPRYLTDSSGNELTDYIKSLWSQDLKIYDVTIPTGDVWNLAGNMVKSVKDLTVQGTLVLTDSSLLRTFGDVLIDGGKVIIEDSAQVVSEVVS